MKVNKKKVQLLNKGLQIKKQHYNNKNPLIPYRRIEIHRASTSLNKKREQITQNYFHQLPKENFESKRNNFFKVKREIHKYDIPRFRFVKPIGSANKDLRIYPKENLRDSQNENLKNNNPFENSTSKNIQILNLKIKNNPLKFPINQHNPNGQNLLKNSKQKRNVIYPNIIIKNVEPQKIILCRTQPKKIMSSNDFLIDKTNEIFDDSVKSYFYKLEPNFSFRPKMEDFIFIEKDFYSRYNEHFALFALYDGFGGDQVAIYLKDNLHKVLLSNLRDKNLNIEEAFSNTFKEMEKSLEKVHEANKCGSTATVVLIGKNSIHVANVGNSTAYVIYKDKAILMTKDHDCNDEKEVKRIKDNNGLVFQGRVFGSLNLTRCLGSFEFKDSGVLAIPTISRKKIGPNDKFAIIASDGVWGFFKQDDLITMYKEENITSAQIFCEKIVKASLERGSSDNISCIVIRF